LPIKLNFQTSVLRICIDRADSLHISGRITGRRLRQPILFSDVNELVVRIDLLLDIQNFPQAFQRARSFSDSMKEHSIPAALSPEEMLSPEEVASAHGEIATFLLNISTRRHSSWQGFLELLDGSSRRSFSSTLEFLKLMEAMMPQAVPTDGSG